MHPSVSDPTKSGPTETVLHAVASIICGHPQVHLVYLIIFITGYEK
jgi:hypothetical protein